jgi:hypothetical protein
LLLVGRRRKPWIERAPEGTLFKNHTAAVDTKIVYHYFGVRVKNVTIVLEERVADWARIEAAKRRTSVSRMVGKMLAEKMRHEENYDEAMNQFLGLKPERLRRSPNNKLPSRKDTYQDERRLRG